MKAESRSRAVARVVCAVAAGLFIVTAGVSWARAHPPVPLRSPQPLVGYDPWPGFRPGAAVDEDNFPLGALADPDRWNRWAEAYPDSGSDPVRVLTPPSDSPSPFEPRATAGNWERALDAADAGDTQACRNWLASAQAPSSEVRRGGRELAFAVAIQVGDRAAADSLFYRLSWKDGGRTAARLAVWRAVEEGNPRSALSALGNLKGDSGEAAMRAWVQWALDPDTPDPAARGSYERSSPGTARTFLALAAARTAGLSGDVSTHETSLADVERGGLPVAWRATLQNLRSPRPRSGSGGDSEYRRLLDEWADSPTGRALEGLDGWIGRWPDSPHRGHAYLLRAQIHLRRGAVEIAASDLRAARRLGGDAVVPYAELLDAFVASGRGQHESAAARIDRVINGDLGRVLEPELLFSRHRLHRAAGNTEAAREVRMVLEEVYPELPWGSLARTEDNPEAWRAPPLVVPAPATDEDLDGTGDVLVGTPVPRDGPFSHVLWGDSFLSETARRLRRSVSEPVEGESATVAEPDPKPGPASPVEQARWGAVVGFGAGARATGYAEGGFVGRAGGLGFRVRAEGIRTQEPAELPLSRRGMIEAGLAGSVARWRWSLVGEGHARRESDASVQTVNRPSAGAVAADWAGLRLDLREDAVEAGLDRFQAAWVHGTLETETEERWVNRQLWLSLEGTRDAPSGHWEARASMAHFDLDQSGEGLQFLYPDLRLTRQFPAGYYIGVRAAHYRRQGLLMPVAGYERNIAGDIEAWVGSEPSLSPTSFRETFTVGGDWNVPDFSLPAERRDLDLRGGLRWAAGPGARGSVRGEWFRLGSARTWRGEDGFWIESARPHAVGRRIHGEIKLGRDRGFALGADWERQWITESGEQLAYVPTTTGRLEFGYAFPQWFIEMAGILIGGRRGDDGAAFGSFVRWDAEASYIGGGVLEYSLRIENIGNVGDQRWPGLPAYGRGVFGGFRYRFAS